jgi:hypothetical protein
MLCLPRVCRAAGACRSRDLAPARRRYPNGRAESFREAQPLCHSPGVTALLRDQAVTQRSGRHLDSQSEQHPGRGSSHDEHVALAG